MLNIKTCALLSLIGVLQIWPSVLTESISPGLQMAESSSLSKAQGEERPHVVKRLMANCDNTFDNYCFNNGKCMFIVDQNEYHCNCERGFYGPRCYSIEFVTRPLADEHIVLIIFCVILLLIGLAGALYFFCKWYKRSKFSRQQKRLGYKGVQVV